MVSSGRAASFLPSFADPARRDRVQCPKRVPLACLPASLRGGLPVFIALFALLGVRLTVAHAQADASLAAGGLDAGPFDAAQDASLDGGEAHAADALPGLDASRQPDADEAGITLDRSAPRALFVPALRWPIDQPAPEAGSITLTLVIERDGRAQLEGCEQPSSVCDAVRAALLEAAFAPALVHGEPSAARVQVRFALAAADAGAVAFEAGPDASLAPAPDAATLPASPPEPVEYGAFARVERKKPLALALELEEMREVPGAMGDPFRVIDALPGVVPVMTGLPYVYVRGAPPAATAYFYDDIQLPALFHLALGPAVVHPAMVGGIDFYPGVAPARYGRKTGGVVAGKALLRDLKPGVHGELELRVIDLQAYVATPIRKTGRFEVAGRFGYPGLLIKAFDSRSVVQYWDYQLRSVVPLGQGSEFTLIALGSFDLIGQRRRGKLRRDIELQFHRVEARVTKRVRGLSLGSALSGGFERSGIGDALNVEALRLGPKLWIELAIKRASLRLGADMLATVGRIYDSVSNQSADEYQNDRGLSLTNNPIYRSATGRNVMGAYAELYLPLGSAWMLEAGLRTDTWLTGGNSQSALEPRLLVRAQAKEWLALHAAFGLAYQPAVFLIPLPGVSDVALDRGLQRAIQAEVGARFELPYAFSLENKLFLHLYKDMLSFDALDPSDFECELPDTSPRPPSVMFDPDGNIIPPTMPITTVPEVVSPADVKCKEGSGLARISARAYGSEWLLRRAFSEPLSGWLSYTLSKATAQSHSGKRLTPNFDVRHVANLVLQWRITKRWHVALRGVAQSGRFPIGSSTATDARERVRLPPFFRGDLQVARTWPRRWGELRFTFDWLNFTFQREPLGWDCDEVPPGGKCRVTHVGFPITIPLLGVRGTF